MNFFQTKLGLWVELTLLMVVLPIILYFTLPIKYLLMIIWGMALLCHARVRKQIQLQFRKHWGAAAVTWTNLRPMLLRFAISAMLLTIITMMFTPHLLFGFIGTQPMMWLAVMFLYPILSVIPQEIIFRSFFFTRFEPIFPKPVMMILASGLAFGFAHILFQNWVAPILCVVGGIIFAMTYQKHRSLLLVTLEHALYGDFIFTLGLGRYFYHGAIGGH